MFYLVQFIYFASENITFLKSTLKNHESFVVEQRQIFICRMFDLLLQILMSVL